MTMTPQSLLTLEAYARVRDAERPVVRAHRRLRSVWLGEHLHLQFEDERTVRHQIQEMLRIERVFEAPGIQAEIDAYAPLVPDGGNWKATLFIEVPDPEQRRRELARLVGVEGRLYVELDGQPRVHAEPAEGAVRASADKTSAVHFLRFELAPTMRQQLRDALRTGAPVWLGCDHPHVTARARVAPETLASLVADLR